MYSPTSSPNHDSKLSCQDDLFSLVDTETVSDSSWEVEKIISVAEAILVGAIGGVLFSLCIPCRLFSITLLLSGVAPTVIAKVNIAVTAFFTILIASSAGNAAANDEFW